MRVARDFAWKTIDQHILRLAAKKGELDAEVGRWLLAAEREQVHRRLGFGSFAEYVERRLGYDGRTTRDKLRVARAVETLPEIGELLRTGARSWTAVREIARVATPDNEAAWIAVTERRTVREIEATVARRKPGEAPTDVKDPLVAKHRVAFELDAEGFALWCEPAERVRREIGPAIPASEVLRAMAEIALGRRAETEPGYQASLTVCISCERTWRRAGGDVLEVPSAAGACAACDGEVVGFVQVEEGIASDGDGVDTAPGAAITAHAPAVAPAWASDAAIMAQGPAVAPAWAVDAPPADDGVGSRADAAPAVAQAHDRTPTAARGDRVVEDAVATPAPEGALVTGAAPHVGRPRSASAGDSRAPDLDARASAERGPGAGPATHVGRCPGATEAHPRDVGATHAGRPPALDAAIVDLIRTAGARGLVRAVSSLFGPPLRSMTPSLRARVRARDRHRCVVPGCPHFRFVDLHHHRPRAQGGPNTLENVYSLCTAHHRAVHDGVLAIEGSPGTGLVFRHAGGTLYGAPS